MTKLFLKKRNYRLRIMADLAYTFRHSRRAAGETHFPENQPCQRSRRPLSRAGRFSTFSRSQAPFPRVYLPANVATTAAGKRYGCLSWLKSRSAAHPFVADRLPTSTISRRWHAVERTTATTCKASVRPAIRVKQCGLTVVSSAALPPRGGRGKKFSLWSGNRLPRSNFCACRLKFVGIN